MGLVRMEWEVDEYLSRTASARLQEGLLEVAGDCRDRARRYCPVDTGALQGTIVVVPGISKFKVSVRAGSAEVDYAAPVEFGTSRRPGGQPFMRPAAAESGARMSQIIAGVMDMSSSAVSPDTDGSP